MLEIGLKGAAEATVQLTNTAAAMGSGTLEVFSTPGMIALMERAALESVQPHLDEAMSTVGVSLNVEHLASTPVGMTVRAESELTAIDGRTLTFRVAAYAGDERIGQGTHKRCIIHSGRFMSKAMSKIKPIE